MPVRARARLGAGATGRITVLSSGDRLGDAVPGAVAGGRRRREWAAMAQWAILDAPLDCSGAGRGEEHAPAALRAAGLIERLGARDAGAAQARIRDTRRDPDTGVIGAADIRAASTAIDSRVREVLDAGDRPVVIGGDCTLLLGVFQALPRGSGLWFVDGHAVFFDGESSPTGEAADMDLAILTGHGPRGCSSETGRWSTRPRSC